MFNNSNNKFHNNNIISSSNSHNNSLPQLRNTWNHNNRFNIEACPHNNKEEYHLSNTNKCLLRSMDKVRRHTVASIHTQSPQLLAETPRLKRLQHLHKRRTGMKRMMRKKKTRNKKKMRMKLLFPRIKPNQTNSKHHMTSLKSKTMKRLLKIKRSRKNCQVLDLMKMLKKKANLRVPQQQLIDQELIEAEVTEKVINRDHTAVTIEGTIEEAVEAEEEETTSKLREPIKSQEDKDVVDTKNEVATKKGVVTEVSHTIQETNKKEQDTTKVAIDMKESLMVKKRKKN